MANFDLIDWNAVALKAVAKIRVPVYPGPRLLKGKGKLTAEGKKCAVAEHKRRKGIRGLNQEPSRYYQLPVNQAAWGCPELLLKGKYGATTRQRDIPLTCILFSVERC